MYDKRIHLLLMVLFAGIVITACSPRSTSPEEPAIYRETFRPQFHFTPRVNWTNDPNGMVFFEGEYHLFYQHNPFGDTWGHMSWGHAISTDLVHWEHLPVAIPEEDGIMIFSGSAVVDWHNTSGLGENGQPPLIAVYTGRRNSDNLQAQHIAYSNDRGRTWMKYEGNPVLDIDSNNFRDPKVSWHDPSQQWIMVVVLAADHKVRFYGSPDLINWTFLSDFGPVGATGGVWECPDFFVLPVDGNVENKRWVLQVDLNPGAVAGGSGGQYFIGTFDGKTFTLDPEGDRRETQEAAKWVDYGKDYYATVSWSDVPESDGRRIWLAWMNNWLYAGDIPTSPWRGAMTIPRVVSLAAYDGDIRLVQTPIAELQQLRGASFRFKDETIGEGVTLLRDAGVRGTTLEIVAEFEVESAGDFGLSVRAGVSEETLIGYDVGRQTVYLDRTRSGRVDFNENFTGVHESPVPLSDNRLKLHTFVDWSSVEVFVNDGYAVITDRIFPDPSSDGLELFVLGGAVTLVSLDVWELRSIY